jgi:hypothetical protein
MSAMHNTPTLSAVENACLAVMPPRRIRVLLADNSQDLQTFAALLEIEDSVEVVGRVGGANEIIDTLAALRRFAFDRTWACKVCRINNRSPRVLGVSPAQHCLDGRLRFTATTCEIPNSRGAVFHLQAQLQPGICASTSDCELATKW